MDLFGWLFTGTYGTNETFPDHPTGEAPGPFDNLSDADQLDFINADFEAAMQAGVTGSAANTEATAETDIEAECQPDAESEADTESDSDADGEGDGGDSEGGGEK